MSPRHDINDEPVSLDALCRSDPEWAANHIRLLGERLAEMVQAARGLREAPDCEYTAGTLRLAEDAAEAALATPPETQSEIAARAAPAPELTPGALAPASGLTRSHHPGWSGARSVEAAILAVADGAAHYAVWVVADHPTVGSAVYDRVVIGHGHDAQCGWRWRWCGEGDEPFGAGSSTICASDAQRGGETTCIALVAAHLAATAERLRWIGAAGVPGVGPWIYRQPVTPGPRAPGADR